MDEPSTTTEKQGFNVFPITAWLLSAVLLYILSIGPVVYFYGQGAISPTTFTTLLKTLYLPIMLLAEEWQAFADIMESYVEMWI